MILQAFGGVNGQTSLGSAISLRCPGCRQIGTFDRVGQYDIHVNTAGAGHTCGARLCPNERCRTLIFFVWDASARKIAISYPPERLDFDSTNIPGSITKTFEEAIRLPR